MSQEISPEINFPQNAIFESIAPRNSQPTKTKVKAFKARVFSLLLLFAEKSKDLGPLLKSLSKEIFFNQNQKMSNLVNAILQRQQISVQVIVYLIQYYKLMILYQKSNQINANVFAKLLKKLDPDTTQKISNQLLQAYFLNRKCKINLSFFLFLTRKIPSLKSNILDKCSQIQSNHQIRPAQKKQMEKLKNKISKGTKTCKVQAV